LVLKSGAMDGAPLSAEGVTKLADLESREVLLAKAAGVLKAKISQAAYMFNALPSKTVRTIDALRDKQEQAA
ncbi:50S ribosomal protein L10, partial [Tsukamurella conjunctivitidis]